MARAELPASFPHGILPFAPSARSARAAHFGHRSGHELALLWPCSIGSNGQSVRLNHLCKAYQDPAALAAVREGKNSRARLHPSERRASRRGRIESYGMDCTVAPDLPANRINGVQHTGVKQSLAARLARIACRMRKCHSDLSTTTPSLAAAPRHHGPDGQKRCECRRRGLAEVSLPPARPPNPDGAVCAVCVGPATGPAADIAAGA